MRSITLSRRLAKEADRVGGIELMIVWPVDLLGPMPEFEPEDRFAVRAATLAEKRCAEDMLRAACIDNRLVPVRTRVANVNRPSNLGDGGGWCTHLAVLLIGERWVHASTGRQPPARFA